MLTCIAPKGGLHVISHGLFGCWLYWAIRASVFPDPQRPRLRRWLHLVLELMQKKRTLLGRARAGLPDNLLLTLIEQIRLGGIASPSGIVEEPTARFGGDLMGIAFRVHDLARESDVLADQMSQRLRDIDIPRSSPLPHTTTTDGVGEITPAPLLIHRLITAPSLLARRPILLMRRLPKDSSLLLILPLLTPRFWPKALPLVPAVRKTLSLALVRFLLLILARRSLLLVAPLALRWPILRF